MPTSLYVHIPFCLKRCIYCDFVSGIYDPGKASAYIDALKKEISLISENIHFKIPPGPPLPKWGSFATLYIGGGTPTALSTDLLKDLIGHIFSNNDFTDGYEATIEANPGTLDVGKLRAVKEAGMNRLSIGVQSFNDDELQFLHRLHSSSEAEKAIYLAREAGFDNIGIDLIYGIPGQSMESWKKTLQMAVLLGPEHISTYELTVENGTLLYEFLKNPPLKQRGVRGDFINKTHLPDEDKIIEMYNHTIDHLSSSGYEHYEISNFAKPGRRSRHNLNYWDRGDYYAAGLGAHSFINGTRFRNTEDLDEYIGLLEVNKSPIVGSEIVTDENAFAEAIFLGLRKTEGINVESFFKRYGVNILSHYQNELSEMQEDGLIEITNSGCSYETNLRLTRSGLLLSNEVFVRLS